MILLGDFNKLDDSSLLSFSLRQLVKALTWGLSILDKICSNLQNYYHKLSFLHCVGRLDHNVVSLIPIGNHHSNVGNRYYTLARNNSAIGWASFANQLASYNWTPFYRLPICDQMVNSFYDLTLPLLDELLPQKVAKRHTNDRPWITDQFRSLIRRRQAAWSSNDLPNYHRLRNKINRMLPKLKNTILLPNYILSKLLTPNIGGGKQKSLRSKLLKQTLV